LLVDAGSPSAQPFHGVRRNLILVGGIALASANTEILRRLQKRGSSCQLLQFGAEPIDYGRRGNTALSQGLEDDETEAGVGRAAAWSALASGKAEDILHRRIGLNHLLHGKN